MPPVIDKQFELSLTPSDFDPPLKREKAAIPGYWTVEELATELEVTIRYVQYLIKGNPQRKAAPKIKAYKVGPIFLVSDADALEYLWNVRTSKKK